MKALLLLLVLALGACAHTLPLKEDEAAFCEEAAKAGDPCFPVNMVVLFAEFTKMYEQGRRDGAQLGYSAGQRSCRRGD